MKERPALYHSIGMLQDRLGRLDEAIAAYRRSLELNPRAMAPRNNLGLTLCRKKAYGEAIAVWREWLGIDANDAHLNYDLAWWLATCPEPAWRDGKEAVERAQTLFQGKGSANPQSLDVLAAAYAECGQFDKAVDAATKASEQARLSGDVTLASAIAERLALYAGSKPYHQ